MPPLPDRQPASQRELDLHFLEGARQPLQCPMDARSAYEEGVDLPEGVDAGELLVRAEDAGVTFVQGADFGSASNTARLAYSFVSPEEIREGVRRLSAVLAPVAA